MDIYPLITFKGNMILDGIQGSVIALEDIITKTSAEHPLYIFEEDIKDAHFGIYQRLSSQRNLWVDVQPRNHEDIVDLVTAGAQSIVLRQQVWRDHYENIKETVEVNIYAAEDLAQDNAASSSSIPSIDGYIIFGLQQQERIDYKYHQWIKNKLRSSLVYIYENQADTLSTWRSLSVTGIITDLGNMKEISYGR